MRWASGGEIVDGYWHLSFRLRSRKRFGFLLFDRGRQFFVGVFESLGVRS
jgi:hypothetical protein